MKKSIFGLSVALLTFLTLGLHVWACPIPKASVLKTTVCVGDVSVVTPDYDPGSCPPVGDPKITNMKPYPGRIGVSPWLRPGKAVGTSGREARRSNR